METADIIRDLNVQIGALVDLRDRITASHYARMAKVSGAHPVPARDLRPGDVVVGVFDSEPHRLASVALDGDGVRLYPEPYPGWLTSGCRLYSGTLVRRLPADFDTAHADHVDAFLTDLESRWAK